MKTSTIIRFLLAVLCTTLVCIGFAFGGIGLSSFLSGSWYFFIRRAELTKPIPVVSIAYGILLAGCVAWDFLDFRRPESTCRVAFAMVTLIAILICIYFEWKRAKNVLPNHSQESAVATGSGFAPRSMSAGAGG
jgi:hypothetical protein